MYRWFPVVLIVALLSAACGPAQSGSGRVDAVVTYSILGDVVRNVGGEHVELTVLVGPEQDAHTFEPSPANAVALAQAELVFENGLGFEPWLDDLYQSSGSKALRVVTTSAIEPIDLEEEHHEDEHDDEAGHEHGEADPHVWHDPTNVRLMVQEIAGALTEADPAHAEDYAANADRYAAELEALDAWIFEQVEQVPDDRRKLVTTHDTFSYFAERYGFTVVGSVLPATTEGASPSAQELAALIEAVKAESVPAIFAENVSSNALLNQVAREAGVTLVASLYTDALGPPGSDADTYLKMMRYNVTTITSALAS